MIIITYFAYITASIN